MIRLYKKGEKVQLSENFSSLEFDCHCKYSDCTDTHIDSDLILFLEKKRKESGDRPIHLNCGYRCSKHNREVGGKSGSYHLIGKAADIVMKGMSVNDMASLFHDADGLGIYHKQHFIHVDVRGYKSRWHD